MKRHSGPRQWAHMMTWTTQALPIFDMSNPVHDRDLKRIQTYL